MIINHNLNALNAHRNMGINNTQSGKSMEKLSSGLRINRAGDDAAGLAISEKMRGQIRGLDQASRNSQDGISLIQTAEGALNETHSIIQRMRELAVQAGNDTNTTDDRKQIQEELNQLTSEVNRIGNTTEFNTQKLLDGNKTGEALSADRAETLGIFKVSISATGTGKKIKLDGKEIEVKGDADSIKAAVSAAVGNTYTVAVAGTAVTLTQKVGSETGLVAATADQIGAHSVATTGVSAASAREGRVKLQIGANQGQSMSIEIGDMRAKALKISGTTAASEFTSAMVVSDGTSDTNSEYALDVSNHDNADKAVKTYDNALNTVSTQRAKLGALQNRLEHTIANLGTSSENLTAAESRVRDVDMAKEMMNYSKNNILQQASQAMLAQANQTPQQVLQLLQ